MPLGRVRRAVKRRSQPDPPLALSAASRAVLAAWHCRHRHWRLWSASLPPTQSGTVWSSSNGSGVPGVMSISLPQPLQFGPSLSQMRSLASCLALPRSRCVAPMRGACCIRVALAMVMRWAAAAMRGRAPIFTPLCSFAPSDSHTGGACHSLRSPCGAPCRVELLCRGSWSGLDRQPCDFDANAACYLRGAGLAQLLGGNPLDLNLRNQTSLAAEVSERLPNRSAKLLSAALDFVFDHSLPQLSALRTTHLGRACRSL